MSSELCKLRKELSYDPKAYIKLVSKPKAVCMRCGRVANKSKYLCKPQKFSSVG